MKVRFSSKYFDKAESFKDHHCVVVHGKERISKEVPHFLAVPETFVAITPFSNRRWFYGCW